MNGGAPRLGSQVRTRRSRAGTKSDKSFTAHWPLQTPTCYGGAGLVERLAGQLASDFEPQSSLASFRARFLYSPDDVLVTRVRRTG